MGSECITPRILNLGTR